MHMYNTSPKTDVRFLLLPLPEFAMLPFGGFVDKLRFTADEEDYSRQHYCSWLILGDMPGCITSSSGVAVQVQATLPEIQYANFDYLVVFGGRSAMATQGLASRYRSILSAAVRQGVKLVSIDNACFLLAACGLLDGHKVAIHWRHEAEFRACYPRIETLANQIYCFDGDVISCSGGSSAIDLAVEILARACGRSKALKGLSDMLVDEARSSVHLLKSQNREMTAVPHLGHAISLMRTWMASHKTTTELSEMVGISRRQLDRLFVDFHHVTARQYWTEMKLQHAKWRLLNSSHSIPTIADEIGIADTSYFGKLFSKRFGVPPATFRRNGLNE